MKTFEEAVIALKATAEVPGNTEERWVYLSLYVRQVREEIPYAPKEPEPKISPEGDISLRWSDGVYTYTVVSDFDDGNLYWETRCGRIRLDGGCTTSFMKAKKGLRKLWGRRGGRKVANDVS